MKDIRVKYKNGSFPGGIVPVQLQCLPSISVDILQALLLLGSYTIPNGLSRASPARFWAWIRYLSAIATTPDLRITAPFLDLDPHQKGILSDDFGVALSMRWLFDRLGGFAEVVDGRRFVLQYKNYLHTPKKTTPKVGRGKCPDFVVRDSQGKWHVIECKGTQSGASTLSGQMKVALAQKNCIAIQKSLRGFSLAAGVVIAGETDPKGRTEILIADPEAEPYITIEKSRATDAEEVMRRLAVSRALGLAGMETTSEELSLPIDVSEGGELLSGSERFRLSRPSAEREGAAVEELQSPPASTFVVNHTQYRGRTIDMEIPGKEFRSNTGCSRAIVRQGINEEFVQRLASSKRALLDEVDIAADEFLANTTVTIEPSDVDTRIRQGDFFYSELKLV